jgi:hypothetical protein
MLLLRACLEVVDAGVAEGAPGGDEEEAAQGHAGVGALLDQNAVVTRDLGADASHEDDSSLLRNVKL